MILKKRAVCFLALVMLALCPLARGERVGIPAVLAISQRTETEKLKEGQSIKRTYPHTANPAVDEAMRQVVDALAEAGRPHLRGKGYLDVGASVYRTGKQWMSFLTVGRIDQNQQQTYVDFDARVFDMETGSPVALTDLFGPESGAWQVLENAVREQLTAYFDGVDPDADALDALCARDALERTPFTLTPAKLSLHYRADRLYPEKQTRMHVKVYYHQLRDMMTALGREITDNSKYKLLALTYDDGPARGYTMAVMNELRLHGADATFFLVGTNMRNNYDVVCRQHDAGYTLASHNYYHVYDEVNKKNIQKWTASFNRLMNTIVGTKPAMMRAPGGHAKEFAAGECNLPLIQWSAASDDAPGNKRSVSQIASKAKNGAGDGAIILMHDLNPNAAEYTQSLLDTLEQRGYLCVTVDDLFAHYGVELLPNKIYKSAVKQAEAQ